MKTVGIGLGGCLLIIAAMIALSGLSAFILMWAWNFVMPYLFNLPQLSFLQAWAFMIVLHIVLSGARAVLTSGK